MGNENSSQFKLRKDKLYVPDWNANGLENELNIPSLSLSRNVDVREGSTSRAEEYLTDMGSRTTQVLLWSDFDYHQIGKVAHLSANRVFDLHRDFLLLSSISKQTKNDGIYKAGHLFDHFDNDMDGNINFCQLVCAFVSVQDGLDDIMKQTAINALLALKKRTDALDRQNEADWLIKVIKEDSENDKNSIEEMVMSFIPRTVDL
ncbi:hypothetical protein ACOME3_003927 [Neoechinorhynchus agilis]